MKGYGTRCVSISLALFLFLDAFDPFLALRRLYQFLFQKLGLGNVLLLCCSCHSPGSRVCLD